MRPGEFVALLGANGSGKSTLVRAHDRAAALTAGSVSLFGTPHADFRDWHRIGFVPQRASAGSGVPATVWEVVASGRLTRRRLLRPLDARRPRARSTMPSTSSACATARRDGVSQLSGGQQQRVLIARALAGEPDLLFLDEPTAGVDLPNQQALADALGVLKARGATIVLVAHELGPMAPAHRPGGRDARRPDRLRRPAARHDGRPAHAHHHHRAPAVATTTPARRFAPRRAGDAR